MSTELDTQSSNLSRQPESQVQIINLDTQTECLDTQQTAKTAKHTISTVRMNVYTPIQTVQITR